MEEMQMKKTTKIACALGAAVMTAVANAQFSELWHQTYDDPAQHGYEFDSQTQKRRSPSVFG
jgi:hypothetical protein